jgi:hypothetical protein
MAKVRGPAFLSPMGILSTLRMGMTSDAVPGKKSSSADAETNLQDFPRDLPLNMQTNIQTPQRPQRQGAY